MKKLFLPLLFAWISMNIYAQETKEEKYKVKYKSGDYIPPENVKKSSQRRTSESTILKGKKHVLIQFYEIPSQNQRGNLEKLGVVLLEFIPNYAYWGYLKNDISMDALVPFNIRSIENIKPEHKISNSLKKEIPTHAAKVKGKADLRVSYFKDVTLEEIKNCLLKFDVTILKEFSGASQIEIRVDKNKIDEIAAMDEISFVYPVAPKPTPNNYKAVASHRTNVLKSNFSWGKNLSGEGVVVGVGDGGYVTPHADLQNRVINFNFDPPVFGVHGDHVSGTVGGAGNKFTDAEGMAHKATILTSQVDHFIWNGSFYYENYGMVLTNNSYGYPGSTYDYNSRLLDLEMRLKPSLQHVFAAHNFGPEYGSVAGGWPRAKNVLTVGSTSNWDEISSFSGRGPTNDGRIKPEIVGLGESLISTVPENDYAYFTGTSMASPGVTGTLALLYQRYRQLNNGQNPKAGLMKALVVNTADDFGNPGPDYNYGFGRINGRRAVDVLEAKQYFSSSIAHGQSANFSINVPSGATELKVMLYWNDYEAAEGANPALVQNLNLAVTAPNGTFNPWVLNPNIPSALSTRGIDNLNNIEQVTIANPSTGAFSFKVMGANVPMGPQEFFIVYEVIKPHITVTFPIGGESFNVSELTTLRWDASGNGPVNVSYTLNNGVSWINIASNIPAGIRHLNWLTPNEFSGAAKIRVSDGTRTSISPGTFSIMTSPYQLNATPTANGEITLTWDSIPGANSYDAFLLSPQDTLIKLIGSTVTPSYTFKNLTIGQTYWMSVRAKSWDAVSERAFAISAQAMEVDYKESEDPSNTEQGIFYSYYEGTFTYATELKTLDPIKTGKINNFDISVRNRDDNFGFKFHGYFYLPEQGEYTFYLNSDDGSILYIGDRLVVDNDSLHPVLEKSGKILLKPGYHSFTLYFFERLEVEELSVRLSGPNIPKMLVPDAYLKRAVPPVNCSSTGIVIREVWKNISGTSVSAIPVNTPPDETTELNILEAPRNVGYNFGSRIRGYFCAPQTGKYVFYISGDDNSELWLSMNDDPSGKTRIAYVPGWTNPREWTKYATQKSDSISLTAGGKYFFEVLHKESGGGDNVAAGWVLPNGTKEMPIPGNRLSPYQAPINCTSTGTISWEQWKNVTGKEVSDIPLFSPPDVTGEINIFEGPVNISDIYGSRYSGFLCAPQTGNYTFWISSDDKSELWLSTNAEVSNKVKIAYVNEWTNFRQWEKNASQKSATIYLEAGKKYYVEALHKEFYGGDNLSVGWQLPDGALERPIPGSRLSPMPFNNASIVRESADEESSSLEVFPIPASDKLHVQFSSLLEEDVVLTLSNGVTQSVMEMQTLVKKGETNISFSTAELQNGMYFLNIKMRDKIITRKIQILK